MKKKILDMFICMLLITTGAIPVYGAGSERFKSKTNSINISSDIIEMLNEVNESTLRYYLEKFVSFGAKRIGSENCRDTAEWIHQEFENLGLYTYFDEWRFPRYRDRNVIAIQNGIDPTSDAVMIACAHYDTTKTSPGANDDGSGIAAMLTIANITSKQVFNQTIRFVAVSGEEVGTYGSFADAKKAYQHDENIIVVINLDCLGQANNLQDGNYVHCSAPERTNWLVDLSFDIAKQYNEQIALQIAPLFNCPCDHDPYNDFGYDGGWISQYNLDYDGEHTPNDTIDKINFTYLSKLTKLTLALTATLAMKPLDIQVRITAPCEGCVYLKNIRLIKLPCYNFGNKYMGVGAATYLIGKTTVKVNIISDDTISYVYFAIDGSIRHHINTSPYEYTIGRGEWDYLYFLRKGYHRITVSVITYNGEKASDEMDIIILKFL